MDNISILTIMISILTSSTITLLLSSFIIEPRHEKRAYIFNEKKRVYDSITTFAQIVLFPTEARFSLGVERYNIQELKDDENIKNAINDLKMAIPKVILITKNKTIVEKINKFIAFQNEEAFHELLQILQKDLYR